MLDAVDGEGIGVRPLLVPGCDSPLPSLLVSLRDATSKLREICKDTHRMAVFQIGEL